MRSGNQVKIDLAAHGLALAQLVAPDGKLSGSPMASHREWTGHGPDGAKWGVVVTGAKAGRWQNFGAQGVGGRSFLSLIRDAFCGGDHLAAWRWAHSFLDGKPAPTVTSPRQAPPRRADKPIDGRGLWLRGERFDWQGPVGRYLSGRGIDPAGLDDRHMGALRYGPAIWNSELQRAMPAMLAAVIDPLTREQTATHRTYLHQVGERWQKAPLEAAKKLLGRGAGGLIPLTRGASGKPLAKAPPGDRILLAEGIENALSVALWERDRRAFAYVSAANLGLLDLPEEFADILLVCDRDGMNEAVTAGREATVGHWWAEGRTVALWTPPPGYKDANDYLRGNACLMTA